MIPGLVHHRFQRVANEHRSRVAIRTPARDVTFGELAGRRDRLVAQLLELASGRRVAILSNDHVVVTSALLAILEAGHAFAPLDAALAVDRVDGILEALGCDAVVVDETTRHRVAERPGRRLIELGGGALPRAPVRVRGPDEMCSIYFTSGSTGTPRAIAGRLAGIDHHIAWEIAHLGLGPDVRGAIIHAPTYDAYLPDVLVPLCAGGVACAPAERDIVLDATALCAWLVRERITLLHCVPSLFRALLACPQAGELRTELRHVLLAGEVVRGSDVRIARDLWGDRVRLINLYGPTEATLVKAHHDITEADLELPSIPIGRPMPGVTIHVLDDGELAIQSPYGALGYLNNPELTRAKFRDAWDGSGERVYLTGDHGTRLPDGRLLFQGRRDRQIKLWGARIDLDEVEAVIGACPDVAEAVVVADESVLHGMVVLAPGGRIQAARAHASHRLPPATRLAWLTPVPAFPRTPSGKLDRRRIEDDARRARADADADS